MAATRNHSQIEGAEPSGGGQEPQREAPLTSWDRALPDLVWSEPIRSLGESWGSVSSSEKWTLFIRGIDAQPSGSQAHPL